jgi:hypothetical protein
MALPLVGPAGFLGLTGSVAGFDLVGAAADGAAGAGLPPGFVDGTGIVFWHWGQRTGLPANSSPTWSCLPHEQEKTMAMKVSITKGAKAAWVELW